MSLEHSDCLNLWWRFWQHFTNNRFQTDDSAEHSGGPSAKLALCCRNGVQSRQPISDWADRKTPWHDWKSGAEQIISDMSIDYVIIVSRGTCLRIKVWVPGCWHCSSLLCVDQVSPEHPPETSPSSIPLLLVEPLCPELFSWTRWFICLEEFWETELWW